MRFLVLVAALTAVSSGCVTFHLRPTTELGGPEGVKPPPPKSGDVQVWIASAPAGVVANNGTVTVAPSHAQALELVGRTRVTVARDPSEGVAFLGAVCGLVVCAPVGFGWWLYYILTPWPDPLHDPAAKNELLDVLKAEAKKAGADSVVFVEITPTLPDGQTLATGFLLRHRAEGEPASPPPSTGAKDVIWRY